jgi:hypothetical protein
MATHRPAREPVAEILETSYPKPRMSSASEPESPTEATQPPEPERPPGDRPKKKKLKPKPPPPPMSEEQIDSPNRQTIGMLGVIALVTFFLWIFARGGCNYHPPKETRDPRKVDLVELARDPKDAAIEFELRYATKSFGGTLELAKGPMVDHVKQQAAACDADANCAQKASTLRGQVQVAGQLLERDPFRAVSRVITHGASATPEKHIIKVERDGQIWKTISREVDDGSFKPRPPGLPPMRDGQLLMRMPGMPGTENKSENKSENKADDGHGH